MDENDCSDCGQPVDWNLEGTVHAGLCTSCAKETHDYDKADDTRDDY